MYSSFKLKLLLPIAYFSVSIIAYGVLLQTTEVTALQYVGMAIAASSFVLWIVARFQLADNFSLLPKANHLVTTGLYKRLRHPVYYFSITAFFGLTLAFMSWLLGLFTVLLCLIEMFRIRKEEALLIKEFGATYKNYQQSSWL